MFIRMLKLEDEIKNRYDLSSHSMRHSRRGTLPERDQTANDELVGAHSLGVLRGHRAQWHNGYRS